MIKVSLLLYLGLFGIQLGFYFLAPSFYVSSTEHLKIPSFIVGSFIRYFGLVLGLYIVWACSLGLLNGLLLKLNRAKKTGPSNSRPNWALCIAQLMTIGIYISWQYPAAFNNYPILRHLPLMVSQAILICAIIFSASYFLRHRQQALLRGIPQITLCLLLPVYLLTLFHQPSVLQLPQAPQNFSLDRPDILLLGMDALDGDTGNHFLEKRLAGKKAILFKNAVTPLPLTHPAWNSILSGLYPKHHGVRYFFDSPQSSKYPELFLPQLLKRQAGYQSLFASDQPETSYFTKERGFDDSVIQTIGWEAHMVAMLLNHFIFPALWLNNPLADRLLPDHFNHASLFNYDLKRFMNRSFEKLSLLKDGPKFLALHTCFVHTPIRLSRQELQTIPNYWKLAPKDFSFQKWPKPGATQISTPKHWVNPYFIRRHTMLGFLDELLKELKTKGYIEQSIIVLLSDHGERFVKEREIYGGVHGVDLKTRAQTNVILTFLDPKLKSFATNNKMVSLIDVTPTLLNRIGIDIVSLPFDGIPLIDVQGRPQRIGQRPIWVESMGYIDDAGERVKFPQIAVKTLEESLEYGKNGSVTIGKDYYNRVIKKKEHLDFSKDPTFMASEENTPQNPPL